MRPLVFLALLICFHNIIERSHCKQNSTEHATEKKDFSLLPQSRDQVLSITPATEEQANIVKNISSHNQTVLWQPVSPSHIRAKTEVHLYVPSGSLEHVTTQLDKHKIKYSTLLENTQELIEKQTRNDTTDPRSLVGSERYLSLEDIYHWMNKTSQEHSEMVKVMLIGSSFEKRPLFVLKLSGKRAAVNKAMWIDCGIHAREWISPAFCVFFTKYALTYYNVYSEITTILNKMDIYVLPVLNPDGYKYTWTTNRMWRKNRSVREDSECVGVDLNRNFDAKWCSEGASSYPCSEIYCGQFPGSEPEVEAVTKFIRSNKDTVKLYFSMHSYSQMLLFPYSYTYEQIPNHAELLNLVKDAAMQIRQHYKKQYRFGASAQTIYLAPGGSDDWVYDQGIQYSFTFELQDQGKYGFLLPPSMISSACNDALLAVRTITLRVLQKLQ